MMLQKLRNKFLLMNVLSTVFLLAISFCVIFYITYSGVEKEIKESVYRGFFMPHFMPEKSGSEKREQLPPQMRGRENYSMRNRPQGEATGNFKYARVFSVYIDENGEIHTSSMFGENNEYYKSVAEIACKQKTEWGGFKHDGAYWRFGTRELTKTSGRIISIVDVTSEHIVITKLIISFLICGIILLVLIFFMSLMYANKVIKPVREVWEKQKQFVADASHELKTPLAAINANVDVLLSNPDKKVYEEEKWLSYIKSEATRLASLTDSLLFMARLESEACEQIQKTNISELTLAAVLNLEANAFEKGKTFDYHIDESIMANVDSGHFTRLVLILIDNAIKYSPEGDAIKIKLTLSQKDFAVLSVKNGGEPIPRDEQKRIFDRFYRMDKSRTGANGYGLGLSMASEIVRKHKGKISVSSDGKSGTVFTVMIPSVR